MNHNLNKAKSKERCKNPNVWNKTSNYSAFLCLLISILLIFFENYIYYSFRFIYILGVVSTIIFLLSEFMKFYLKKKK